MKYRLLVRISVIIIITTTILNIKSLAQCEDCGSRGIVFYEAKMVATLPDTTSGEDGLGWLLFRRAILDCRAAVRENDPNIECIIIRDGGFVYDGNEKTGKFSSGNQAPQGALPMDIKAEYLVTGEVTGRSGSYVFTVNLETAISRKKVVSFSLPFKTFSDVNFENNLGTIAGIKGLSPISEKIKQFEEEQRQNIPEIAIKPNSIEVLPEQESVKINKKTGVSFRLIDCDGKPLAGRKILLNGGEAIGERLPASTKGRFLIDEVITDDKGEATAEFKAGSKAGIAQLKVYFVYSTPWGDQRYASGNAKLEIESEPITELVGEIVANEHTHIVQTHEGKKVNETTISSTSISSMDYSIIRGRLETLQDIDMFNRIISEDVSFGILHGSTLKDAIDEPTNIKTSGKTEIYSEKDGKLKLVERSSFEAASNGADWNISIEPLNTSVNEVPLAAVQQKYCVTSMMSGNVRLFTSNGKYKTNGITTGIRMNDFGEMENFSEEFSPNSAVVFPEFRNRKPVKLEEEVIEPMAINNNQALTEYLLDPNGIFTVSVNGKRTSDYNGERVEYTTTITITMWPEGTADDGE
jgi:hypothetical protein